MNCEEGVCVIPVESCVPYCYEDSDCNDGKLLTSDKCINPTTCGSYCENNRAWNIVLIIVILSVFAVVAFLFLRPSV